MPPGLALRLTLISSNCPCLEHNFMVPKVIDTLEFYGISIEKRYLLKKQNLLSFHRDIILKPDDKIKTQYQYVVLMGQKITL